MLQSYFVKCIKMLDCVLKLPKTKNVLPLHFTKHDSGTE